MRGKYLLLVLGLWACGQGKEQHQPPTVAAGRVESLVGFASELVNDRHVEVWLPEGYTEKQRYDVLYMHDGQMLFDSTITWNKQEWGVDETVSLLMEKQAVRPMIVVGIWNSGATRHADYFPQKPFNALPKSFRDSLISQAKRQSGRALFGDAVRSDAYLRFLVEELKPYVDAHYATKPGRDHTFVAGSSMGGLISMYALCEYPDVFGGAACLSTHWPGIFHLEGNPIPQAFLEYLKANLPDPATHKLYFDYGTETLDALYPELQRRVDEVVKNHGFSPANWQTRAFPGEAHQERAWQKRLHLPLMFLMPPTTPNAEQGANVY